MAPMPQSRLALVYLLFSSPLCLVTAYESSPVPSVASEVHAAELKAAQSQSAMKAAEAKAAQEVSSAESEAAGAQSAMQAAEAKAAQQIRVADSKAAEAQSAMRAAEAKSKQAESRAEQAQLAEKAEAAKAARQVSSAHKDVTNAQSAERSEEYYAAEKMKFMSNEAATQIHIAQSEGIAQSEAASARAEQTQTNAESAVINYQLVAFLMIAIIFFLTVRLTKQGRAFKERVSERISGMVGRKDDKKKPLLEAHGKVVTVKPLLPDNAWIGA